jgi:hypothetical protein
VNVETALWVKRQASNVRFYSPVILHGTLYVGAAVAGVIVLTLKEWKTHEENITPLDIKILWATCLWFAFTNWLAFMSNKVAEMTERKKKRDETDAFAKGQPDQTGRLKTLG